MAETNKTAPTPKALYARLPAKSYQKLRRLARLPTVDIEEPRKGLLVRVSPDLYQKLRRISLAKSASSGRTVGMQSVLAQLIDEAKLVPDRKRRSMARVTSDLIRKARAVKGNGSP